jgi:hypothetical protein
MGIMPAKMWFSFVNFLKVDKAYASLRNLQVIQILAKGLL